LVLVGTKIYHVILTSLSLWLDLTTTKQLSAGENNSASVSPSRNLILRLVTPKKFVDVVDASTTSYSIVMLTTFGNFSSKFHINEKALPESEALPRVRFCAESKIKNSRQTRLCRERNKKLLTQKNTRHRGFFTESQIKNSRKRKKTLGKDFFAQSKFFWLSAKKF
jgi:hypothetical protein